MAVHRTPTGTLWFDRKEVLTVFGLSLLWAFILTFQMWGEGDVFDASTGLFNLSFVFLGILVVVLMHEWGHKIVGSLEGYSVRIEPFTPGLFVSLFVGMYSQGYLPFITPNLIATDARPDLRMGRYRVYDNPSEEARIAAGGLAGSVVAIAIFKFFETLSAGSAFSELFGVIVFGAVLHAGYSLIPWELVNVLKLRFFQSAKAYTPGDGLHLLWYSVFAWVFAGAFIALYGLIALFTGTVSFVAVLVLAGVSTWLFSKVIHR